MNVNRSSLSLHVLQATRSEKQMCIPVAVSTLARVLALDVKKRWTKHDVLRDDKAVILGKTALPARKEN